MQLSKLKRFIEIMVFLDKGKGEATSLRIRREFGLTYPQVSKLLKKWEAPENYFKNLDSVIDVPFVKSTRISKKKQLLGGPKVYYGLSDPDAMFLKDLAKILADYGGSLKDTPKIQQENLIKDKLNTIIIEIHEGLPAIVEDAGFSLQDKRGVKLYEKLQERLLKVLEKY